MGLCGAWRGRSAVHTEAKRFLRHQLLLSLKAVDGNLREPQSTHHVLSKPQTTVLCLLQYRAPAHPHINILQAPMHPQISAMLTVARTRILLRCLRRNLREAIPQFWAVSVNGAEMVQPPSPPLTIKRRKPLAVPIRVVGTPNVGAEIAAIAITVARLGRPNVSGGCHTCIH
jgi:hypothetical protein